MVSGSAQSNKYAYDLTTISHDQFDILHTFIRSVFDQGRQRFTINLATMTNQAGLCPEYHWPYLFKTDSLGVSMTARGNSSEFHVWINPSFREPLFKFYMTLVHELVHGYAGLSYGHNAHWRRWFYRTMWHLVQAEIIPAPEDELKYVCTTVEHSYNQSPKIDPMLTILEAFNKAESEHEVVKTNYFRKLGLNA